VVGVDTLKLRLTDYEISPKPHLKVRFPDVDAATGDKGHSLPLWPDGNGGYVQGARAYHNSDCLKVSVGRLGSEESAVGTLDVGCWVEFSVPRLANDGDNYQAVSERETARVLKKIGLVLKELGIKTNIGTAAISRLDTFANVETEEPFPCYAPLFSLMQLSRMPKRDYGTTFLFANGMQEWCIYDKPEEMKRKAMRTRRVFDANRYPANVARFENRLLKPRKIRDVLGIETAGDLMRGGYGVAVDAFKREAEKHFFSRPVADVEAASARQLESEMRRFKEQYGRNWQQRYLQAEGLRNLAEIHGLEVVVKAVASVTGADTKTDKRRLQRLTKDLNAARFDLEMLQESRVSKRTLGELYEELQSKLLNH
jgi:hypothetical protein